MARIHRLQHVKRLLATALSNHNPVWAHAQGVNQQFALPHRSFSFEVRGPRLQPDDMGLLELQFGGILNG